MNKAEKRQAEIISILSKVQASSIAILAEKLNVSTETIRQDLNKLSEKNEVVKAHGSVMLQESSKNYFPFDLRRKMNRAYKSQIGIKASELVTNGDTILLENSTTSLALIEALINNKKLLETLTIVTNSFSIAALIENKKVKGCFFLGGWMDFSQHATVGNMMQEVFESLYVDKAFLSAAAINQMGILSSYYENDMVFQKLALQQSRETILMVGKDKYPKQGLLKVASIAEFSKIVTAADFSKDLMEDLRETENKKIDSFIVRI